MEVVSLCNNGEKKIAVYPYSFVDSLKFTLIDNTVSTEMVLMGGVTTYVLIEK